MKFAGMNYNELKKEAAARKIKFIGVKAVDLVKALEEYELKNNGNAETIISADISVSEKIRQLTALGIERKAIAKMLNIRYQFVRNVQVRAKQLA